MDILPIFDRRNRRKYENRFFMEFASGTANAKGNRNI